MKRLMTLVPAILLAAGAANAKTKRSETTKHTFQRTHPCPSTGRKSGACPGYVKDHIIPLCKGGADKPSNMQWQTSAAGKVKDRTECKR